MPSRILPDQMTYLLAGFFNRMRAQWTDIVAALICIPACVHVGLHEGGTAEALFTGSVTLALATSVLWVTRRPLVTSVLINATVFIIIAVSAAKQKAMDTSLHAYDAVFYLGSWSTVSYLVSDYPVHVAALTAALCAVAFAAGIAYRFDRRRTARSRSAAACLALVAAVTLTAQMKGERRHMQYYLEDQHVGAFYASWAETAETLWRGQLMEASTTPGLPGPIFNGSPDCKTSGKPPHIILIHEESVFPPSLFQGLDYDRGLDAFFASHDGRVHRMRVETYGGASWLTEFSVLTGLSSRAFGGMRLFVESLMAGKLRDTLPQALSRCGYHSVVYYPLLRNFVSNAKFYSSIGIDRVLDAKDQKAPSFSERDRFYFSNMLAGFERHIASSPAPLFAFLQTMATHSPYDYKYMPEVEIPGGGPGTDPEISEYLRRVAMAKQDYDEMKAKLKARFPGEAFLLVHYGDHQPVVTRSLLGLGRNLEADDIVLAASSPGMLTYFAIDGINYTPPALPDLVVVDVPFMPHVILEAARLPLSDAFSERKRLMAVCHGSFFDCEQREQIMLFHRRLIESGLVDARLR